MTEVPRESNVTPRAPLEFRVRVTPVYRVEQRGKSQTHVPVGWSTIEITADNRRMVALVNIEDEGLGGAIGSIIDNELAIERSLLYVR